jgi:hypothetical protein
MTLVMLVGLLLLTAGAWRCGCRCCPRLSVSWTAC